MVFGTSDLLGPSTDLETRTSQYMQQAWLAFVKDPKKGLLDYGWPLYNESTESLVRLGLGGSATAVSARGDRFDATCQ